MEELYSHQVHRVCAYIYILPLIVCVFYLRWKLLSRSRSFKVIQDHRFWYQSKARPSNLGPILHRFEDIASFCAPDPTTIPLKFWGYSRCTRSPMLGSMWAGAYAIPPWNYFRRIPTYVITLPERHGGADHGQTTYGRMTALCVASRGKMRSLISREVDAVNDGFMLRDMQRSEKLCICLVW